LKLFLDPEAAGATEEIPQLKLFLDPEAAGRLVKFTS
jgi:hypothetical protein